MLIAKIFYRQLNLALGEFGIGNGAAYFRLERRNEQRHTEAQLDCHLCAWHARLGCIGYFFNKQTIGALTRGRRRFRTDADDAFFLGFKHHELWKENQITAFRILVSALGVLRPFHQLHLKCQSRLIIVGDGNDAGLGAAIKVQTDGRDAETSGVGAKRRA